jgi:hypothetical protein
LGKELVQPRFDGGRVDAVDERPPEAQGAANSSSDTPPPTAVASFLSRTRSL